jgi:hypothetical protein
MTAIIILNIVFAAAVIVGIVGMLSWSIASQDLAGGPRLARSVRRRRHSTARARVMARPVNTRA